MAAKARVDAVQEFKKSFKDTVDYLYLMRYAVNEYKASNKRVVPTFDGEYYDCLISGKPATLATEDSIETLEEEAEQEVASSAEPE